MSIRALLMGLLLALAVAALTYFNDQIVRQTFLLNHHLPAPVFAVGFALLLLVNPLVRRLGVGRPMRLGEVGVVLALGLAACGWPGTSFFRYFTHLFVLPAYEEPLEPGWQGSQVLSYVPGEHGRLGAGYLRDPAGIQDRLLAATPDSDPAAHRFASSLPDTQRAALGQLDATALSRALQPALDAPDLARGDAFDGLTLPAETRELLDRYQAGTLPDQRIGWLNRRLLEATFTGEVIPLRRGRGVLPAEGRRDPAVTGPLMQPDATGWPTPAAVPWSTWWPTIRLWGGASVLTALAVLCLMVIVHPQWSRRELLAYPTVRFIEELARPGGPNQKPGVLSNRLFWIGFGAVVLLHTINGLSAWFPGFPEVARSFNLSPLGQLFPNAAQATGFWRLVNPVLYPTAIGFAFFISTRVALSVGLALPAWVLFSAVLIGMGVNVTNHRNTAESLGPCMRFGAFVGIGVMAVYLGRHYYLNVVRAAVGGPRRSDVPGYAPWAARGLVLFSGLVCLLLWRYAGIDLWLGGVVMCMVLLASLVLARLNAESGLFYVQPDWYPVMMLLALLGAPAIGPELMIVLMIASFLLMPDPREGIAPFLINALRFTDTDRRGPERGAVSWIGIVLIGSFAVALVATLSLQYRYGLSMHDYWAPTQPRNVFQTASNAIRDMASLGQLTESLGLTSLERLQSAQPAWGMVGWMAAGLALVLGCAGLSLRLPWWSLHPILFVIWGTHPSYYFSISFLVGGLIKWAVVHFAGERAFHAVKPMMVGLIVADLTMILFWVVVGAAYFLIAGLPPAQYHILPY